MFRIASPVMIVVNFPIPMGLFETPRVFKFALESHQLSTAQKADFSHILFDLFQGECQKGRVTPYST